MLRIQPPLAFRNGVFLENRIFYISFSTTLFMLLFDKPYGARRGLKCCSVFAKNVSVFAENVFVFARREELGGVGGARLGWANMAKRGSRPEIIYQNHI
jgi:hypothetical protein